MKVCKKCNIKYDNDVIYCGQCGSKLLDYEDKKVCSNCGHNLNHDDKFCPYCGKVIDADMGASAKISEQQTVIPEENKLTVTTVAAANNNTGFSGIVKWLFGRRLPRKYFWWQWILFNTVALATGVNLPSNVFTTIIVSLCTIYCVRRTHDMNCSWRATLFNLVFACIPGVNLLVFLSLAFSKSYPEINMWGECPGKK